MHYLKKIILVSAILGASACAAKKSPSPDIPGAIPVRAASPSFKNVAVADAEQGMKRALDAGKAGDWESALLISRRVADLYPNSPWYRRSLFLALQAHIQLDHPTEADAAMLRVQAEYPELADYALFLLAEYHFSKERYSEAAALYQQLVDRYPKGPLAARGAFRRGQALLASYAYFNAIGAFEKILQDNPRSEFASDAGIGLAQALTAEAQLDRAVQTYRDVWIRHPGSPNDQEAERALAELKASGVDVPEFTIDELYERGKNLYRMGLYDKATEVFMKILAKNPAPANRSDVLFHAGVTLFNLGRRGECAVLLEKMARDYPGNPRTPEALYWIGKAYTKLGDSERAVNAFQRILDRYPDSDWADDALFFMGNIYRDSGDMKKASLTYGRLVQEYPESRYADSAIWWKAWSYFTAGDYKKSEQALGELVNRYPRSLLVNQARYWQGRISEKTGNPARAIAYYEQVLKKGRYTYYGYRASERKSRLEAAGVAENTDNPVDIAVVCGDTSSPDDPLNAFKTSDGPPVWTDDTQQLLSADASFRKTLELMSLDMKKEAAQELWALQDKMPRKRGTFIGLSKAFFNLGDYYRSLKLVLRNFEQYLDRQVDGTPDDLWRLAYPQGYWESVLSYSRKYGQDPYFIEAIIREESQFSSDALSPAGARGLMQVMPATGKWVARRIKLRGYDRGKLFDSDMGINIGTWYIGHLLRQFKGDLLLATAAYNAGPDAVIAWLGKYGYNGERDAFVEAIPFSETRAYVKKVLRNYNEYKRIYGKPADALVPAPQQPGGALEQHDGGQQAKYH